MKPICLECGDEFAKGRHSIGYKICLPCGDYQAKKRKFTVAPINKSNYMLVTDLAFLKQLNPKRTT